MASDFIFGRYARVWFDQVDLRVRGSSSHGTITANDRASPNDPSYFVINNSTIDAAAGDAVRSGAYFLGQCIVSGQHVSANKFQAVRKRRTRASCSRTRI